MNFAPLLYLILIAGIAGAFMYFGALPGSVIAFIALIIVGMWRRYAEQDGDQKFADAAAKHAAKPTKQKKSAAAAKPIAKPGARMTVASVKPKRLRPPTWKTPTRK